MANIQHPEGLEEGLRQSAAGEVMDLDSFEQYADDSISGISSVEEAQVQAESLSDVALATEAPGNIQLYIPIEDRKVGEIFELSEEDKDRWANGRNYEHFTITRAYDENYAVPVRPDIISTYTEDNLGYDLGYLIQQTEDGFRYIGVELGEDDDFGPFVASKKAALQGAVANWRAVGHHRLHRWRGAHRRPYQGARSRSHGVPPKGE